MKRFILFMAILLGFTPGVIAQSSQNFRLEIDVFDNGGLGLGTPRSQNFATTAIIGQSAGLLQSSSNSYSVASGAGCLFCAKTTTSAIFRQPSPDEIQLEQNFPNPFNPGTTIRFTLNRPAFVDLSLYSPLGVKVMTIFRGRKPAGVHDVRLIADDLPSGMYVYRLTTKGGSIVRKLVLSK
ncbi:MAG: T9SS type A sorting domain-containing protein [Chlorobi bacterium]|nr:T9SS type A sorting domain-containing protein [Chlorobiota bacterium]